MTTTTAAKQPLRNAVGAALAEKTASRSALDIIKAAPAKARTYVASTLKTLKIDAAGEMVGDMARWVLSRLRSALSRLRFLGLRNAAVVVAATPLRRKAVEVAGKGYRIATLPLRWVGRATSWGLNRFALGRKVTAKVAGAIATGERFVARKVEAGLCWMEVHETSRAMRYLRTVAQSRMVYALIRKLAPRLPMWAAAVISAFVPVYDVRAEKASYTPAVAGLAEQGSKVVKAVRAPRPQAVAAVQEELIPDTARTIKTSQPSELHTIVLEDTSKQGLERFFEALSFIDERGQRRTRLGSQYLLDEEMPDTVAFVGPVIGHGDQVLIPAPAEVKEMVQTTTGAQPPRAARRHSNPKKKAAAKR